MNKLAIVLFGLGIALQTNAKIKLPNTITNNMVLQQQTNASLWGHATPNKAVSIKVSWAVGKAFATKADANGNWLIKIPTPKYGGPYTIKISDGDEVELKNILIGDVWICSGQSNMEMPFAGWGKINNYEQEIKDANFPNIRLLQLEHVTSKKPLDDATVSLNGWNECSPATIPTFSTTAYFFAREVFKKTGIPIGLIHTSWGGTIAEAWTSARSLKEMPDFKKAVEDLENTPEGDAEQVFKGQILDWKKELDDKDPGYKNRGPIWQNATDLANWKNIYVPDRIETLENGFDGTFWLRYQFKMPASWVGQTVRLSLGEVDDDDIVWVNGEKVGETVGYAVARNYTIPNNVLKAGDNSLTVRVFDSGGDGGIFADASKLYLVNEKNEKISLVGDWKYRLGANMKDMPRFPVDPKNPNQPTLLYNAMIHPLLNFAIKGAIWYQGESNADRAYQYRTLFPKMIADWRSNFKQGDFPFYFVQLASFMAEENEPKPSAWAELREAQLKTLAVPNTGMAVTIDIGDAKDIHPKNKQDVGKRLAYNALAKTYKMSVPFSGPLFKSVAIQGNEAVVSFTHGDGIKSVDGKALKGFEIAGADQKFYWADAKIVNGNVIVSSREVAKPVAVRYAWANNPVCSLTNASGLPASPFRTDDWKGVTEGKK